MPRNRPLRLAMTVLAAVASALYACLFTLAAVVVAALHGELDTGVGLAAAWIGALAGTAWAAWQTGGVLHRVVAHIEERQAEGNDR